MRATSPSPSRLTRAAPSRPRPRAARALAGLVAIALTLPTSPPPAEAAGPTELVDQLSNDVTALAVNTPVWLAQHLPAMMAQTGIGAGAELGELGDFAIGLMPARVGILNGFSAVGAGTDLLGFADSMPDNLPWPQFGVSAAFGLGLGFSIAADVQFVPDMNLSLEPVNVEVGMISAALAVRWRINEADGALPAFIIGVGGSYYHGSLGLGANYQDSFTYETERVDPDTGATVTGTFEGEYGFDGGPSMGWDLFQVSAEIKVAWSLGPVRPYFGFGFGYTMGSVWGGAELTATGNATFTATGEVGGQSTSAEQEAFDYSASEREYVDVAPAQYLLRPHIGLDFVFGIFGLALQVDYALVSQDPLAEDLSQAGGSFQSASLYSDASANSSLSENLIASLSFRFTF